MYPYLEDLRILIITESNSIFLMITLVCRRSLARRVQAFTNDPELVFKLNVFGIIGFFSINRYF